MRSVLKPHNWLHYLLAFAAVLTAQEELVFSHPHGIYEDPFTLTVDIAVSGAQIKYTLDGTNPLTSASTITQNTPAAIDINAENTSNRDTAPGYIITVCATLNDTLVSAITSQTYLFINKIIQLSPDNQRPGPGWMNSGINSQQISYGMDPDVYNSPAYASTFENALLQIPTMSLVTDLQNLFDPDSGIYVNANMHGLEWERPASLELLNPDGSEGFQINCGIRIRGGWSRHPENPKHAFRVFFRNEYGEGKLDYPLFGAEGADEFNKVDLRTAQNYSWSYTGSAKNSFMRDVFSRDAQGEMGQPYTRSRFYHLYINGTYWGLFQTQERSEASFGETYFGGNKEDYDIIKRQTDENYSNGGAEATDGNIIAWRRLWNMSELGFADNDRYFEAQGLNPDGSINPQFEKLLDIENLIDYMLNTFFVGDFDGPVSAFMGNAGSNNYYCLYNRVNPDGFKFFRHDAEHSLFNDGDGNNCCSDRTGPFPAGQDFRDSNPQWIHQRLSENVLYRNRFADRVYKHFYNDGVFTYQKSVERVNRRKAEIDLAIIAESARWGDSKRDNPLTKTDWENEINYIITEFLPGRNETVIGQLMGKGLFSTISPPQFSQPAGIVEEGFTVSFEAAAGQIYYTLDGSDPFSPFTDDENGFNAEIISPEAAKKVIVPTADIGTEWQTNLNYNDDSWLNCIGTPGGAGYETGTGIENLITLNLESFMTEGNVSPNGSAYIRIPFEVSAEQLSEATVMILKMQFDDGFVAYLNGEKIAEQNAPLNPVWNSFSTDLHEAGFYQTFDVSDFINSLQVGTNLLAVQGFNISFSSSDFIILPTLELSNITNSGSPSDNAIEYNSPFSINHSTTIKARALQEENWSPLNEVRYLVPLDLSGLRITELHYHPLVIDTIVNDTEYEFLELKNNSESALSLSGVSFVNGIDYTFPANATIQPGAFIVLASNAAEFFNRYGFAPYAEYDGQLNNGGERIVLVDALADTLFNIRYNDKAPWPTQADGDGYSLVAEFSNGWGDPANSAYWKASGSIHGSPMADDIVSALNDKKEQKSPTGYFLQQNYPNPFNPLTAIQYTIPVPTHVTINVYTIIGKFVKELINEQQPAGTGKIVWDGTNRFGNKVSSGIYLYQMQAGNFVQVRKMLLLK